MANFIVQGERLPQGDRTNLIFIDNLDGTFTMTVGGNVSTYPSLASAIVAGSGIKVGSVSTTDVIFPGIPPLSGTAYTQVQVGDLALNDNDVYTCPVGKRAFVAFINFYNHTGSSRIVIPEVKISGTYYKIGATLTVAPNASNATQTLYVLNAGESLAINADGATAVNMVARVTEFSASAGLKTVRLNALAAGNNTLYTVPAGKQAIGLTSAPNNNYNGANAGVNIVNFSGSARSLQTFSVKSGGAAGSSNQYGNTAAAGDKTLTQQAIVSFLNAGDFIVVATDAATAEQTAYMTVYEF